MLTIQTDTSRSSVLRHLHHECTLPAKDYIAIGSKSGQYKILLQQNNAKKLSERNHLVKQKQFWYIVAVNFPQSPYKTNLGDDLDQ